jgi:hypothetical protein
MTPKPINKSSISPKYSDKVNNKVDEILLNDNILDYIVKVAQINHKSDEDLFKIAILSCIQHSIKNYNYGLYINVVGSAGKGKSHALNVLTKLLPANFVLKTSITPKSLYQASDAGRLDDVKIIFSDDISFENADLIETLKKATSEFDSKIQHMTLINNKPRYFEIKPGLSYWFTSVASIPDSQLSSRFINISIDESEATDIDVMKIMTKNALGIKKDYNLLFNTRVCQCIFDKICSTKYDIVAPFGQAIGYSNVNDRRLIQSFLSTFKCVVFLNRFKRKIINNQIIAELEDFDESINIFSKVYETHKAKLSIPELRIFNLIKESKSMTINDIIAKMNYSDSRIRKAIDSLMEKTTLSRERITIRNDKGLTGKDNNKTSYYYFIPNKDIDMNKYMPKGKLADIFMIPNIIDDVVDSFWREAEEMIISEPPKPEPVMEKIIKQEK